MREYARLILVLLIPLLLVSAYSVSGRLLNFNGYTVAKARLWQSTLSEWRNSFRDSAKADEVHAVTEVRLQEDTAHYPTHPVSF